MITDNLGKSMSFVFIVLILCISNVLTNRDERTQDQLYKIDGKVSVPFQSDSDWTTSTRILVDGDQYIGFVK